MRRIRVLTSVPAPVGSVVELAGDDRRVEGWIKLGLVEPDLEPTGRRTAHETATAKPAREEAVSAPPTDTPGPPAAEAASRDEAPPTGGRVKGKK